MEKGCFYWIFIGCWLEPMICIFKIIFLIIFKMLKEVFLFIVEMLKEFFLTSRKFSFEKNRDEKKREDFLFLDGEEFKEFCVKLLKNNGFSNVKKVSRVGNHGADILANMCDKSYIFQCKSSNSQIDNKVVHEVYAGKEIYKCDFAVVIANNFFNKNAVEDANLLNVELWDIKKIDSLL